MNISLNQMAAMLPPDFKHLLHISCGEGEMIRGLAERHDALFTGITEIRDHLAAARGKGIGKAEFFLGGHHSLYFHDSRFDVVVSSEEVKDFREIHRVLTPKGRFIMPCSCKFFSMRSIGRMKRCGFERFFHEKGFLIAHKAEA